MDAVTKHPHEARVQRIGYAAAGLAGVLAAVAAATSPGRLLGVDVPLVVTLGATLVGLVASIVAVQRRSTGLAAGGSAALILGVLPGGASNPGVSGYAVAFAFGAAVLALNELVYMTQRYDRAHKLVEEEGASEEGIDRVTDEALKTLGSRLGLATAVAASAALIALGLSLVGPGLLREAAETASPLGVALLGAAILLTLAILILARGARAEAPDEEPQAGVAPDAQQ